MNREELINEVCKRVLQLLAEGDTGKKSDAKKELILEKRAITERDVITARENGVHKIVVNKKAILTDLAKEYAHKYQIDIVRNECSSDVRGQGE